jgi:hypothetical protein
MLTQRNFSVMQQQTGSVRLVTDNFILSTKSYTSPKLTILSEKKL